MRTFCHRVLVIVALFLLAPKGSTAQKARIDSLTKALAGPLTDSARISTLALLSRDYCLVQLDSAFKYGNQLRELATKANNIFGMGAAHDNLGIASDIQGNYPLAQDHFFQALRIFQKAGLDKYTGAVYSNLAGVFLKNALFDQARAYYDSSLTIRKRLKDLRGQGVVLNNLAGMYARQQKDSLALAYAQESLAIKLQLKEKRGIAYSHQTVGISLFRLNRFDESLPHLQEAIRLFAELGDQHGLSYSLNGLGVYYLMRQQPREAIRELEASYQIAQQYKNKDVMFQNTWQLGRAYAEIGDFRRAYGYDTLCRQLKDSILHEDGQKKLRNLKLGYELDQKQAENARLIKEEEAQRKQLVLQQAATITSLVALLASGALAIVFFRGRQKERQAKEQMAHLNEEVTQQRDNLQLLNEELHQKNEEIAVQRDDIGHKSLLLTQQNEAITASINYAQRIQTAILPAPRDLKNWLPDSFVWLQPRDIVSGDFYWFVAVPMGTGERLILAAVDCTGHGVPGAFMSMIGDSLLSQIVLDRQVYEPDLILAELNLRVRKALRQETTEGRDGMDAALVAIDFDAQRKPLRLHYAGAMNPLYYIQGGEFHEIKADKMPIGGFEDKSETPFVRHEVPLDGGPLSFFLFSDGFQDQFGGPDGRKFMVKRFKELLTSLHHLPAGEQLASLRATLHAWQGSREQVDDILVIGARL
jgi:serine phosphatase RsbU (regulator of sigma subunit)